MNPEFIFALLGRLYAENQWLKERLQETKKADEPRTE